MAQKLWTRPFIMIMGINFLIFLSFNMINPSLPLYFQDLGISETMTGVCISIFTVGSVIIARSPEMCWTISAAVVFSSLV